MFSTGFTSIESDPSPPTLRGLPSVSDRRQFVLPGEWSVLCVLTVTSGHWTADVCNGTAPSVGGGRGPHQRLPRPPPQEGGQRGEAHSLGQGQEAGGEDDLPQEQEWADVPQSYILYGEGGIVTWKESLRFMFC